MRRAGTLFSGLTLLPSYQGFSAVCGVDEAGRGPLAGPVVSAACIVPQDVPLPNALNDSKQMTEAERELAYEQICADPRIRWAV